MDYAYLLLTLALMYVVLAVSYNLLIGYAGLLSIAHAAFVGFGAYAAGLVAVRWGGGAFPIALAVGALAAAAVAGLIAVASLKLSEEYLIISTLGLQVVTTAVLLNWVDVTGGARGLPWIPRAHLFGVPITRVGFLCFMAVLATVIVLGLSYVVASPYGRVLRAMRENAVAAQAFGKNVVWYRTQVFLIAGALAGLIGGVFAHYIRFVEPFSFTIDQTNLMLAMVIVGGIGNIWGSVLGAALLFTIAEGINFLELPASVVGPVRQMVYGASLVVCMLFRPQGLIGEYLGARPDEADRA